MRSTGGGYLRVFGINLGKINLEGEVKSGEENVKMRH